MSASWNLFISGLCFAIVHGCVKLLPRIPPYELVFFRAVISIVITYFTLRSLKISVWGNNKPMLILRGLIGTSAVLLYFHTLQNMPLASAVTIQYLHPIFTVILAGVFMKEHPKLMQWFLFTASFAGVVMVRGFDARISATDLAIGILAALCSSVAYTTIRALRGQDHALVVVFYLPLVSLIVIGPYTLMHWVQPQGMEWLAVLIIGFFTQVAQYFMTRAYQSDRAANISNLNYLGIIYALGIGIIFFNETVELLGLIGMGVIALSALLSTRVRS